MSDRRDPAALGEALLAVREIHPNVPLSTCDKPAKHDVDGVKVCGIHKRLAEKWQAEDRLFPA